MLSFETLVANALNEQKLDLVAQSRNRGHISLLSNFIITFFVEIKIPVCVANGDTLPRDQESKFSQEPGFQVSKGF